MNKKCLHAAIYSLKRLILFADKKAGETLLNVGKKEEPNRSQLLSSDGTIIAPEIYYNSTTLVPDCQCTDCIEKELAEKFTPKKAESEKLVMSYLRLGYDKKAERCSECGTLLEFTPVLGVAGGESPLGLPPAGTRQRMNLYRANFCRDRLCPMCSWRRSYKIFGQVSQIMDQIANDYEFLFLTLTVPNCTADELVKTLNAMSKAWIRFTHYAPIKRILKGFFKALEITYNLQADTYHPHLHNVLAVPKGYFKSRDYIKRDDWLNLWQKAMNDYSITQVDIRRARGKIKGSEVSVDGVEAVKALSSAIAEIAKYAVKSSDYLFKCENTTDKVVSVLVPALSGRRLCSFGGCFAEAHQMLQLDDAEDGDLVHVNNELRSDLAVQIYRYGWSCGAYKLIEIVKK